VLSVFGSGFLIKEGIDRHWLALPLPMPMRLALVALFGVALLRVVGWRLRRTRRNYALSVQAGGMAVLGIVGGFMAPLLTATNAGNHVPLFGYYTVLNLTILAIAWFKAWRELNVLGFLFTFFHRQPVGLSGLSAGVFREHGAALVRRGFRQPRKLALLAGVSLQVISGVAYWLDALIGLPTRGSPCSMAIFLAPC
jgi:uncharacterized membrane protein